MSIAMFVQLKFNLQHEYKVQTMPEHIMYVYEQQKKILYMETERNNSWHCVLCKNVSLLNANIPNGTVTGTCATLHSNASTTERMKMG